LRTVITHLQYTFTQSAQRYRPTTYNIYSSPIKDVPVVNWFDSNSDLPGMSSVNTTPYLGVNVGQIPVNRPQSWAQGDRLAMQQIQPPIYRHSGR